MHHRRSLALMYGAVLASLVSCHRSPAGGAGGDSTTLTSPIGSLTGAQVSNSLVSLADAKMAADEVRARLAAKANLGLNENLAAELARRKAARQQSQDVCTPLVYGISPKAGGQGGVAPTAAQTGGAAPAPNFSTTNNQVAGVDEADIVKTDGIRLYAATGSTLQILSADPTAATKPLGVVSFAHPTRGMLLLGSEAVVITQVPPPVDRSGVEPPLALGAPIRSTSGCTYGYDCDFAGDGSSLEIVAVDATLPSSPTALTRLVSSASYLAARRIDDRIIVVTQFNAERLAASVLKSWISYDTLQSTCGSDSALESAVSQLKAQNNAAAAKLGAETILPQVTLFQRDANGKETRVEAATTAGQSVVYASNVADSASILSVVSFRLHGQEPPRMVSVLGQPGPVYVSVNDLLVASRYPEARAYFSKDKVLGKDFSALHHFRLSPAGPRYAGTAFASGLALNSFSMDVTDSVLRVATSDGHPPEPTANYLSTFSVTDSSITALGQLGGFGAGEDIRSARFDGKRAFVVTFKKTDPLFYFDLSDAAHPKLSGQLEIPGFSTYMHLLDAGHLLTIGYDADDQGTFAFFNGILLQIFDVTNPAQPSLASRVRIGTRGSGSQALTDHLAFNYFAPDKLLALPITVCDGGGNGTFGNVLTFNGTQVYRIDVANGITLAGQTPIDAGGPDACFHWWSDSETSVTRTVIVKDTLWSFTANQAVASVLANPATVTRTIAY